MEKSQRYMMGLLAVTTPDVTETTTTPNTSLMNQTTLYDTPAYHVLLPTVWGIIVFVGAVGNIIVIFTMCKHGRRSMPRSATNCYITNVAVADLAFILIVVPITIKAYLTFQWNQGVVMCKLNFYIIYVTLMATCLTLTAMTTDRYFAIVHPIRSMQSRTPKAAVIICIAIWIASLAVCSPYLMVLEVEERMSPSGIMAKVCVQNWPAGWEKGVAIIVVLVTYVIPLTIIIISYTLILRFLWRHRIGVRQELNHNSESSEPVMGGATTIARRRRKVAKMIAAVVILFAITWLPIHVFTLCFVLIEPFPMTRTMYDLKIFAHTLSYTSSCVNPFVYTIMGDGFRKAFRQSLPSCGDSPSTHLRPGYSRRTGSTVETRFNGD